MCTASILSQNTAVPEQHYRCEINVALCQLNNFLQNELLCKQPSPLKVSHIECLPGYLLPCRFIPFQTLEWNVSPIPSSMSYLVSFMGILEKIDCRRCSNYIFILNLTPGFNGLGKDNCKTRRETFVFGDWVRLILKNWRYLYYQCCVDNNHTQPLLIQCSIWGSGSYQDLLP